MSSTAGSPDGMALNSHYSLRWNNHQAHILQSFEALLQAEVLVDVTLVCAESSLKAHKVVLSACSPFFERIFAEHPCKHPVIVLKDYPGREIVALIDFMYRGEVRVGQEDLPGLMRAAENLQVRGLASSQPRPASPPATPSSTDQLICVEPTSPEPASRHTPDDMDDLRDESPRPATLPSRLPHMTQLNFGLRELRDSCGSPLMPRRKQARPRRRSGEPVPQDLSRPHPPASLSPPVNLSSGGGIPRTPPFAPPPTHQHHHPEDVAENLSIKRSLSPEQPIKTESECASSPRASPLVNPTPLHHPPDIAELPHQQPQPQQAPQQQQQPQQQHHHGDYLVNLNQLAAQWLPPEGNHHPPPGPPHYSHRQSESPLSRRPVFPLDPLFPPPVLDFQPDALGFLSVPGLQGNHTPAKKVKKHRGEEGGARRWDQGRGVVPPGRPKGQHSAPRGGPPRSWTNAELTQALQHVWNKKMTTSQASRVFGIPYNSLLMYVRGKYGKSLKLEQLKNDCIKANTGEVMNSLNNNVKNAAPPPQMPAHPLGLSHEDAPFSHHHLLGANLSQGFFPDFGPGFPVPMNMIHHLLPAAEQKGYEGGGDLGPRSRTPSPMRNSEAMGLSAPTLLQQNGSD